MRLNQFFPENLYHNLVTRYEGIFKRCLYVCTLRKIADQIQKETQELASLVSYFPQ